MPRSGACTEGYGILQPRVSVTFTSAAGSLFARVYSGHTGVDPYTTAVSDTYQDLFGEGIFTGKGLYDVDAFVAALEDRVPGERAAVARPLRGAARAGGPGLRRGAGRRVPVERARRMPAASTAGSAATGRSSSGCFRSSRRARGLEAQHAPAISALEDLRQPAAQPRGAHAARAARRRVDSRCRAPPGSGPSRSWQSWRSQSTPTASPRRRPRTRGSRFPVFLRNLREDVATAPRRSCSAHVPAYHAYETVPRDRADARAARGDPGAGCSNGRPPPRRPPRRPGSCGEGVAPVRGDMAASPTIALVVLVHRHSRGGALPRRRTLSPLWLAAPTSPLAERPVGARLAAAPAEGEPAPAHRPEDLALLRNLHGRGRPLAPAGQLPGRSRADGRRHARHPPTSDGAAVDARRARPRLPLHGDPGELERLMTTMEGLERHDGHLLNWYDTYAGTALAALHLDRRQRQPGGALIAVARAAAPGGQSTTRLRHLQRPARHGGSRLALRGPAGGRRRALRACPARCGPHRHAQHAGGIRGCRGQNGACRVLVPELTEAIDVFARDASTDPDRATAGYWARSLAEGLEVQVTPAGTASGPASARSRSARAPSRRA